MIVDGDSLFDGRRLDERRQLGWKGAEHRDRLLWRRRCAVVVAPAGGESDDQRADQCGAQERQRIPPETHRPTVPPRRNSRQRLDALTAAALTAPPGRHTASVAVDSPKYLERFRLDGRTALITGASRNIGAAIARAFAAAGANLIVNARTAAALDAFAAGVRERYGVEVTAIAGDLAQPGDRARLIDAIVRRGTAIDILVNNATSGGRPESGLSTSPEMWRAAM